MKITLANLEQATEQQVFDQVAKHLLTQHRKSLSAGGTTCLYRGEAGTMCAAGCLIADDEYDSDWEGRSWESLTDVFGLPDKHYAMITGLQRIHDALQPLEWKENLHNVALGLNLEWKF